MSSTTDEKKSYPSTCFKLLSRDIQVTELVKWNDATGFEGWDALKPNTWPWVTASSLPSDLSAVQLMPYAAYDPKLFKSWLSQQGISEGTPMAKRHFYRYPANLNLSGNVKKECSITSPQFAQWQGNISKIEPQNVHSDPPSEELGLKHRNGSLRLQGPGM
jgi:hypothetical protein